MNAKISMFVLCVEAIICLLLYSLHDCTFNSNYTVVYREEQYLKQDRFRLNPKKGKLSF